MSNLRGSWWHKEAREMKCDGHTAAQIAKRFGKSISSVERVTAGVRSPRIGFSDFTWGVRKQLAVRFRPDLMERLNCIAIDDGVSVSSVVVRLVEQALHPTTEARGPRT